VYPSLTTRYRNDDETAQEIAGKHKMHPTQVVTWKRQAINGLSGVFSAKAKKDEDNEAEIKDRRTFITNAARKISSVGGSLRDVQSLAGHSSLTTTQRYIEVNGDAKRRVVDM